MMTMLQEKIRVEISVLPLEFQKEVLDFILFLQERAKQESDTIYLSENHEVKQAIIDGLHTPLSECSEKLEW
jgi:hypothetical protein